MKIFGISIKKLKEIGIIKSVISQYKNKKVFPATKSIYNISSKLNISLDKLILNTLKYYGYVFIRDVVCISSGKHKQMKRYPFYFISDKGEIISFRLGLHSIKTRVSKQGYRYYNLRNGQYSKEKKKEWVHRLVLETWKSPPEDMKNICRHLDGNPENNYIKNLVWGSFRDNAIDREKHKKEKLENYELGCLL